MIETNRNDDMVTWCRCIKLDLTRRNGKFENTPHTPKWADGINRLRAEMVTKEKLLTRRNGRFRSQLTRRNGHFEPKATRRTSHFFY